MWLEDMFMRHSSWVNRTVIFVSYYANTSVSHCFKKHETLISVGGVMGGHFSIGIIT